MGGDKGAGKAGKAHDYYGTIAGVVCAGPVDELVALILDGKLIWPWAKDWTSQTYPLNALTRHSGRIWLATEATGIDDEPGVSNKWAIYTVKRTGNPNPYPLDVSADGVSYGRAYFYWGTADQTLDTVGEKTLNDNGHPPYRNQAVLVLKNFLFGRERTSAPNIEVVVRRAPNQAVITGDAALDTDGQANPLAALADAVTNPVFGVGQPAGLIDASSWQTIADALDTNSSNAYISPLVDRAQSFRSFAAALLQYYDGWLRASGLGTIEAGRFLHNEAPPAFTDATTIDYHDAVEEIGYDANGWQDTYNDVLCRWTDPLHAFTTNAARAANPYNRQVTGEPRTQSLDRPWIHRMAQALHYAHEWGYLFGVRSLAGTIQVRAEKATSIRQGDLFKLTHDALSLSIVCRCVEKNFPTPPSGYVTLGWQSERGIGLLPYQPTPPTSPSPGLPILAPITLYQFVQLPTSLAGGEDFRLAVLAARPNGTITGLRTWLRADDASNFAELGSQRQWNIYGTLAQDYPAPVAVATSSRARASNVATIVTAAAHGLSTGMRVRIGGLGASDYAQDDVEITVTNSTTFTYPSIGADESTTSDTNGLIDPLMDDNSETLAIALDAGVIAADIDKFVLPTLTEDDVADGHLLLFLFHAGATKEFEVVSVRSIRLSGGNYLVKCRRGWVGTIRRAFAAADKAWLVYRTDIVALSHEKFAALAAASGTATFRLQPTNWLAEADLSDSTLCPDRSWTFSDPNAPVMLWTTLQHEAAEIIWSVATSSRARSANVATIVTATAHGLQTGDLARITGLGGSGYEVETATVTRIDATTLTYASTGSDETTASDTGGLVERVFEGTDQLQFSFELTDASGDLVELKVLATLGAIEVVLLAKTFEPTPRRQETVTFKLPADGDWRILVLAWDWAGRVTHQHLTEIGGSDERLVLIRTAGSSTVASPTASPPSGTEFTSFPRAIWLASSTAGATIEYQAVAFGAAIGPTWSTYTGACQIQGPRTIYARALKTGMTTSAVMRFDYYRLVYL